MIRVVKFQGLAAGALTVFALLSACSNVSDQSEGGLAEAAQSCTTDALPISPQSQIVAVGMAERTPNAIPKEDLADLIQLAQARAILATRASAVNDYWRPLADSWAIYEALLRALRAVPAEVAPVEGSAPTTQVFEFADDVNIDFAAITKDTFCRIAFVKSDVPINYESEEE